MYLTYTISFTTFAATNEKATIIIIPNLTDKETEAMKS